MYNSSFRAGTSRHASPIPWSGLAIAITAALLSTYFGVVWFLLYGATALCMQEYNAPFLSFYSDVHECVIAIGDLAAEMAYVSCLIVVPIAVAFMAVCWVYLRIRRSKNASPRAVEIIATRANQEELAHHRQSWWQERDGLKVETQIVFWTLNLTVVLWLVAAVIWNVVEGSVWRPVEGAIGAVLLCALHLYVAAVIGFGAAIVCSLLCRRLLAR
jgi:hypothetical protein